MHRVHRGQVACSRADRLAAPWTLRSLGEGESRRQQTVSLHHTAISVVRREPAARARRRRWEQPRAPRPSGSAGQLSEATAGRAGLVPLLPEPRVLCLVPGADRRLQLTPAPRPAPAPLKETQVCRAQERASVTEMLQPGQVACEGPAPGPAFPSEAPPPGEPAPAQATHLVLMEGRGQAQRPTGRSSLPKKPGPPHAADFPGLAEPLPLPGADWMKLLGDPGFRRATGSSGSGTRPPAR